MGDEAPPVPLPPLLAALPEAPLDPAAPVAAALKRSELWKVVQLEEGGMDGVYGGVPGPPETGCVQVEVAPLVT